MQCPICSGILEPDKDMNRVNDSNAFFHCPMCEARAMGEEELKEKRYINHCWSCNSKIDSRECLRSDVPRHGYHCTTCGVDLVGTLKFHEQNLQVA